MLKVGIRAHDVGKDTIVGLAEKVKAKGFNYIQFVLAKAIVDDNGLYNKDKAKAYYQILKEHDIEVAMLGAYFNPVHSNKEVLSKAISKFKNHLEYASLLNCKLVGTETGSYNDDKWTYNEKNHTEDAYLEVLEIFKELRKVAEDYNTFIAIEGAYAHCMKDPKRLNRLVRELDSDNIKVIVDLFNYLYIGNHEQRNEIFKEAISLMKDKIVLFHLKDYIVEDGKLKQVGLGKGLMDYKFLIKTIKENFDDAYLVFEGVVGDDIDESLEFINNLLSE